MNMIHHFMGCIREYKKPTILTLLCMVGEVAIEVLIPFSPPTSSTKSRAARSSAALCAWALGSF